MNLNTTLETAKMDNDEQIANLQKAIEHLIWARSYVDDACDGFDPNATAIGKVIKDIESDIEVLKS